LIGIFATNQAVGLFALAMKITYLPMTLISTALRQVFYQKAAMQLKSGNLEPFVFKALALITVATTPLLVFFLFNAHWLFSLVFGDAWKEAAIYAIWLVLGGFMLLITSWLDRVFDVLERQRLALTLQTTYDLVSLGIFALVLMWSRKPVWAVAIYGVVTTIYNVIYLVVIYRIARFPLAGLLRIGAIFLGIISFTCVIHWTTIMLFTPVGAAVTYVVSMTIIYGLLVARFIRKKETG
jgi:O-antigen/teichoic acid export membrane protein